MAKPKRIFFFVVLFISISVGISWAGLIYQDFEPSNGSNGYGWAGWQSSAGFSTSGEPVHGGSRSWKVVAQSQWGGTTILSQVQNGDINFNSDKNDRFLFWIYAMPQGGGQDTVSVKFFDQGSYAGNGFEVWTTKTFFNNQWTKLYVLLSQLPEDFDLAYVKRVEFVFYNPGTYYVDDLQVVREDRAYQAFEPEQRFGSTVGEYGWKWNDADTVNFSASGEPVNEGLHSWKLSTALNWSGTGIQSQEKKLVNGGQTFWYVDLRPDRNDSLTFWAHALPQNNMDNNLGVQFYDHGQHHTDETKVVVWPKNAVRYGQWTRVKVLFSDLPSTLDLYNIDKIQFQHYWPGTYYVDDIRATGPVLKINEAKLSQGVIAWNSIPGGVKYTLEESRIGPNGPWATIYQGFRASIPSPAMGLRGISSICLAQPNVTRVTKLWYRVRWEDKVTASDPVPYVSPWSDVVQYLPPSVHVKYEKLTQGLLEWTKAPKVTFYEAQSASSKNGPWTQIYYGYFPPQPLTAQQGTWYRVRGLHRKDNIIHDVTPWSAPQRYSPGQDFLAASGTMIKDANGQGEEVVLQGVNLGGYLLNEKYFTGLGDGDNPPVLDDWTIRDILTTRFGEIACRNLMKIYQDAYIKDFDFDFLKDLGVNMVRLPIFYRILQNDDGSWVLNAQGEIDFGKIDYVVNACANRGIYVLLDLHGAPGAQSPEDHTGRINFNKLFLPGNEGEVYRLKTIALWEAIADHYKDNPWVCGYDLLNEPTGALPMIENLWDLYDRLYTAIRAIDTNHMIVMEAVWDWPQLPYPLEMDWTNVAYQFHYYLWNQGGNIQAHMDYIDAKVADADIQQPIYNVPMMIGEFTGFDQKAIWEYYLQNFNEQRWSWVPWTYKTYPAPSNWGLFNHAKYNTTLAKFREPEGDSYSVLSSKFQRYATADYHEPNVTLTQIMDDHLVPPLTTPWISRITPESVIPATTDLYIHGKNFGETQGSSSVLFNNATVLPVSSWSDTMIHASVPASVTSFYGVLTVATSEGTSNEALLHIVQPPQVIVVKPDFAPVGAQVAIYGRDFGTFPGEVRFASTPGSSNNGKAVIISWFDTVIKCVVPPDAAKGLAVVETPYGSANFYFGVSAAKKTFMRNTPAQKVDHKF